MIFLYHFLDYNKLPLFHEICTKVRSEMNIGFIVFAVVIVIFIIYVSVGLRQNRSDKQTQDVKELSPQEEQELRAQSLKGSIENYPELRDIIMFAKQYGATHYIYYGSAIELFRVSNEKIGSCYAEFMPTSKRFEWLGSSPEEWETGSVNLPKSAMLIPEDI